MPKIDGFLFGPDSDSKWLEFLGFGGHGRLLMLWF